MITLDRSAGQLSQQIYTQFRDLILDGSLAWKDQVPPSRVLGEAHGVSRNTVLQAYERLTAEGFLDSVPGGGLFVARINPPAGTGTPPVKPGDHPVSALTRRIARIPDAYIRRSKRSGARYEFLYGEPSYEDFPLQTWARIIGKVSRQVRARHLSYPDYQGLTELRLAVANYLTRARGIRCEADQVLIVHGTQEAVDLCCRLMINPGDTVICENPGYRGFLKASLAAGAEIHYNPVDEHGLDTDNLPGEGKLVFVTPSHQFPTGSILSVNRRLALIDWARSHSALIFEDDYDGEFRYTGSSIASLKSLDSDQNVVYTGTVSKTFFPALRLGWMVIPPHLTEPLTRLRAISDTTAPAMEQLALAEFINDGHFERHIFRTRKRYAEKRELLLGVLRDELGDLITVRGSDAGIHVLVSIPGLPAGHVDELLSRCLQKGVAVHSAHPYYHRRPQHAELIIGYNAVPVADISAGTRLLAKQIRAMLPD